MEPIIREFRKKDKNKDRVPIPKTIREALIKREIDSLVSADFGSDVRYFTKAGWEQQITYLAADDPQKMEAVVSAAQSVNLQKAGRVLLPRESRLCGPEVKELCIEYFGEFIKVTQSEKDRKASSKKDQLTLPLGTLAELQPPPAVFQETGARPKPKSLPMRSVSLGEIETKDQSFLNRESIEFADLIESMQKHGQQVPVILRGPKPYTIISGFRRIAALSHIHEPEVLAIIYPALDDKRALAISLLENLQRRNLSDYELIRALARMKDRGYNTAELAELIGKGRRIIELYLRVWNSNEPGDMSIKEALKKGEISISAAINAVGKSLSAEQIINKSVREIVHQAERARGISRGPIYFREFGSGKITLRMRFDKKRHNIDQVIEELEKILGTLRDKRENFSPESQSGAGNSSNENLSAPVL